MSLNFNGYPSQCWQVAYNTVNWFAGIANSGSAPVSGMVSPTLTTYLTLRNLLGAMDAYTTLQAWRAEMLGLQSIAVLPITLDAPAASFFNNRMTALNSAINGLAAILPTQTLSGLTDKLVGGTAGAPDPLFLEFLYNFGYETQPAGMTVSSFLQATDDCAEAWTRIANAILLYQGSALTPAYDCALQNADVSRFVSSIDNSTTLTGYASGYAPQTLWNQMFAMPSLTVMAGMLGGTPGLFENQQAGVIRYTLASYMFQFAQVLMALRQPPPGLSSTAIIRNDENLMDVAARALGDFQQWQAIAQINGIMPPYFASTVSGLAIPAGDALLLPSDSFVSGQALPNYALNVLGADIYIGPINGIMPGWAGEFQNIIGNNNLSWALGRRLQTTLGTLIYHPEYGSRIPPEVGSVQSTFEAGRIAAFGKSALASDPRVVTVISAQCAIASGGMGLVSFSGAVQPIGPGTTPVLLNEVLSPLQ